MSKFFHPSKSKLTAWLDGVANPKVDDHIASCERCATTIEQISADAETSQLGEVLAKVLEPPEDMTLRVEEAVASKLESREVLELVSGLFVSGVETSKILVSEDL